jgi:hypothetical protein
MAGRYDRSISRGRLAGSPPEALVERLNGRNADAILLAEI